MKWLLGLSACWAALTCAAGTVDFRDRTLRLWDDLNAGDSARFFGHYYEDARLINSSEEGIVTIPLAEFNDVLKRFRAKQYFETCDRIVVTEPGTGLVHVDVHFSFYLDEKKAFTGVDHVIWLFRDGDYKIDAHYSGALKPRFVTADGLGDNAYVLDSLLNQWHRDVAEYRLDDYFAFMDQSFVFLGTDPSERWTKETFMAFCKPYFDKKSTWDFKPNWRNWYIAADGNTAWFEESLDTWMQECRGTGVLLRTETGWKIAHYNLTVLIENDKIDQFIRLRKK